MNFWLHPDAEADLGNAAVYYAEHANRRIGEAFVSEFERVVELLIANQQLGTPALQGLRTFPMRRFPYTLVYREHPGGPRIYAVAHQHREPGFWRARV